MAEPQKPTLFGRIGGAIRNTFKFAEQSVAAVGGGIGGGVGGRDE